MVCFLLVTLVVRVWWDDPEVSCYFDFNVQLLCKMTERVLSYSILCLLSVKRGRSPP
jgi:hypothetical protein